MPNRGAIVLNVYSGRMVFLSHEGPVQLRLWCDFSCSDFQIGAGKITPQSQLNRSLMAQKNHPAAVDIQDNRASIRHYREPPPGLKWEKQDRGPAPSRSLE